MWPLPPTPALHCTECELKKHPLKLYGRFGAYCSHCPCMPQLRQKFMLRNALGVKVIVILWLAVEFHHFVSCVLRPSAFRPLSHSTLVHPLKSFTNLVATQF